MKHKKPPAWHQLVIDNLAAAKKQAYKIKTNPSMIEDFISAAQLGLVKAAKKFNTERKVRFHTYAVYYMRGAIFDLIAEETKGEPFKLTRRQTKNYTRKNKPTPTKEEIKTNYTILQQKKQAAYYQQRPFKEFEQADYLAYIWKTINKQCTREEANILKLQYKQGLTQAATADKCNTSSPRIGRITNKALSKLRLTTPPNTSSPH